MTGTLNPSSGDRRLDIANSATWPTAELEAVRDTLIANPEVLYEELGSTKEDHDVACALRCDMMGVLYAGYSEFIAYHSCRPLSPDLYLQNGLLVTTEPHLYQRAEEWFGCIDGWKNAFQAALHRPGKPHYVDEWYGGKVGMWFTPTPDYTGGSHFMGEMAEVLGDAGAARVEEIRSQSQPTHVVCSLPHEWVWESQTEGILMAGYASELLRAYISQEHYCEPYVSKLAIHVLADVLPDQILELRVAGAG